MVKINIDKYVGKCYHLGIKIFSVSYASMGWLEKGSGCKSHTAAFTVIGDKRE
jgi:hypothetical protein